MGLPKQKVNDQRRSDRVPVRLVTSHDRGDYPLTLLNLSTTGLLLNSPRPLRVGDRVQIDLPRCGQTVAEVLWSDADEYGCRFLQPIPPSVVLAASEMSRNRRPQAVERRRPVQEPRGENDDTRALMLFLVFLGLVVAMFTLGRTFIFD
ncbi:PilZ domain-containing protein [Croceicoccus naphthovorans]|uniref:PilZ domain-containing protein n=1 Tax=Croceicoccus naphthovorans TaxID=1348774 RepID=UPI00069F7C45|nr:PilZ domain-containing protein [Croceicoccus naphthovorans]MBB3988860.1 hypothetical protein [Croceicoccus naphthovorans]